MNAKEYLLQVRYLDAAIKRLDKELNRARNELITLRSSWPDGQPHGKGGKSDPVGNKAAKLADDIIRIEEIQLMTRARLWRVRAEVVNTIGKVSDPLLQEILYSHYVDGIKWEDVAADVGYTDRHIRNLHNVGLKQVDKIING